MLVLFLGGDSRKHQDGSGEVSQGREGKQKSVHDQASYHSGQLEPKPFGDLWEIVWDSHLGGISPEARGWDSHSPTPISHWLRAAPRRHSFWPAVNAGRLGPSSL